MLSSPQYLAMPQAQAILPQFSSQIPLKGYASKDGYNITGELQLCTILNTVPMDDTRIPFYMEECKGLLLSTDLAS
jgi:hypothetical protein